MKLLALGAAFLTTTLAHAEDFDPHKYICALWAQDQTFMDYIYTKDVDMLTADQGQIALRLNDRFVECMVTGTYMKLDVDGSATDKFVAAIHETLLAKFAKEGTLPASEDPSPTLGTDAWKAQCAAEYNSWDEETGTVVRYGSPKRVPCPCGGEVQCGQ
jgi:hypothetical protein